MTEKYKPINRKKPAVVSIITGDDMGLVSAVLTRRFASDKEIVQADWFEVQIVGGVQCFFVGRGVRITARRLAALATCMLVLTLPWDDGGAIVFETDPATPPTRNSEDIPGIEFGNDPTWQRIMAISAGGAR